MLKQRIALFQWIRPEHLDIPMKLGEDEELPDERVSEGGEKPDCEISMGFLLFAQQGMYCGFYPSAHLITFTSQK